jgi:F-type H+-transporting ATPase subunit delta
MSAPHKEYAKALFELSLESDRVNEITNAFASFKVFLTEDFKRVLVHPNILKADKKDMLKSLPLDSLFANFLYVLIDHNRVNILDQIMDEFMSIINDYNGVVDVKVYAKNTLSDKQKALIRESISKKLSKKVVIQEVLDANLIGGLRLEYLGYVEDFSLIRSLEEIKSNLTLKEV